ncbi:MAG TPA: MBL fold metallo-hydrolase [Thermoplasmata archaeon]|nr:MBL fold metallo-hydrolase [Thermoplasmata archaeon]
MAGTRITFYGGINEIGGNKFLLEDGSARIFLDFGKNFGREKQYFDEPWIHPQKEEHLLALGILPNLPGIYRKDATEKRELDAVLLTHPHTDHYDAIRWLRDDIPSYATPTTNAMILGREYAGHAGPSREYYIANWTEKEGQQEFRTLEPVEPGRTQEIAGLPVTAFNVDHSVLGSVGYVVETKAGNVAYTGDFRLHGARAAESRAFLEKAKARDPVALLIEGTHIEDSKIESEDEVQEKLTTVVSQTRGLVLTGFAPADVDRMNTFHNVAKATDRILVLTARQAFLVDRLVEKGLFTGFDLTSRNVRIFRKEKKTTAAFEKHLEEKYGDRVVDAAGVRAIQPQAILVATLSDMLALPAIDPMPGSVYILSSSEPFNEEMEISFEKLKGWLTRYGLPLFQIHASGHATAHDLRRAVETIRPKKVFLVHTENPALFARFLDKLRLGAEIVQPIEAQPYPL